MAYSIWALFDTPHLSILVLVVLLCNMGGVFNFIAYTFVRNLLKKRATNEGGTNTVSTDRSSRMSGAASVSTVASGISTSTVRLNEQ